MAKNAFFRFRYKTTKIKKYTYQKYISGVLVLHELNFCSVPFRDTSFWQI